MSDAKTILEKYGIDIAKATWSVHGATVIYHWALEMIATKAGIKFDKPMIVRAERDEAVVVVAGTMASKTEWATGEALVGVNYKISGRQMPFPYAMAEKRAKDRVTLKLVELHEIYSEEEAQDFKEQSKANGEARSEPKVDIDKVMNAIMDSIDLGKNAADIAAMMNAPGVRAEIAKLPEVHQGKLRKYALERHGLLRKQEEARAKVKLPENASDRVAEDRNVLDKLRMGEGFGGTRDNKTPDDILADFTDELKYCHTAEEVQATTESYRKAIEDLTPPDQGLANRIRADRLNKIREIDRSTT